MVEIVLHGSYTGNEGTFAAGATVELAESIAADLIGRGFARLPGEPPPDLAVEDHSLPPEPEEPAAEKRRSARRAR